MKEAERYVGKEYAPFSYQVGREKIREFATAVGETHPHFHDLAQARESGYTDLVAPPMFSVVYCGPAIANAMFDPELAINFSMLVHGAQTFTWDRPVVAGEDISTSVRLAEVKVNEVANLIYYIFVSESVDQAGETVCVGRWTNIVRGE